MAWITFGYLLYLALPIVLLLVGSLGGSWLNSLLPEGVTGRWYLELWQEGSFRRAFWASLGIAAATCAMNVLIGLPLAYGIYRAAGRGARIAARVMTLLPIAVPPLVLGFGFILVFSSDTLPFLGSAWLLAAGHVVLTLPYMTQTLIGDMRHLRLEAVLRAAESLGASGWRQFIDIVIPALSHGIATGLITVAALSIGEFQLSNLIAGFLNRTYPVVLLQAFYGATGFACAATMVLLILALLASLTASLSARGARVAAA